MVEGKSAGVRLLYNKEYLALKRGRKTDVYFAVMNSGKGEVFNVKLTTNNRRITYRLNKNNFNVGSRPAYVKVTFDVSSVASMERSVKIFVVATGRTSKVAARFRTEFMITA